MCLICDSTLFLSLFVTGPLEVKTIAVSKIFIVGEES